MSNNKTRKLTKQELKELIKTVIDESNYFKDELRSMIAQEIEKAIAEWIIEDEDPPSLSLPGGGHQNPENKSHGKINEPYETQYRRSSSKKNAQKKRPK